MPKNDEQTAAPTQTAAAPKQTATTVHPMAEHMFKVELYVDNPGTQRGRSMDKSVTVTGTILTVVEWIAQQVKARDDKGQAGNIARINVVVEQPAGAAPSLV